MDEMNNVAENEMNEEIAPVEEGFEELVPTEEEVIETNANRALETALILAGTAIVGHVLISTVTPGVKKGAKTVVGWGKNLISKGKSKKSKKEENSEDIVEADCKEVEETPDEEKEVVED